MPQGRSHGRLFFIFLRRSLALYTLSSTTPDTLNLDHSRCSVCLFLRADLKTQCKSGVVKSI